MVADPHPTTWAALAPSARTALICCRSRPATRPTGSRTSSNRAIQWGEQIVKPIFESKDDNEVMYLLAKKLGFADRMFKNIKVDEQRAGGRGRPARDQPRRLVDRLLRPVAGAAEVAYGESERLRHASRRRPRPARTRATTTVCRGRAGARRNSSIPARRCSTTPTSRSRKAAAPSAPASAWSARKRCPTADQRKVSLLGNGYYSKDSEIKDGYPEFTYGVLKKLGWDKDLTEAELAVINKINPATPDAVSWSIDLSGGIQRVAIEHGCIPYGNGKARANAFGLPDADPDASRADLHAAPELVAKYPTLPNAKQFRMPNIGFDVQKAAVEKGIAKQFPLILTSGRLVEYEGGGEETRSNKWLAELQQDMFIEINPADAAERGIKDGGWVWVTGAETRTPRRRMKALVTERVGKGVTWCPFHFAGWFQGVDQRGNYPKGADPIVLGESVNALTTYGFDPVTGMQEPKATLCQIRAA